MGDSAKKTIGAGGEKIETTEAFDMMQTANRLKPGVSGDPGQHRVHKYPRMADVWDQPLISPSANGIEA